MSQYLLWETCCKNYTNKSGTFLCKEVKFLPVRHNFKFKYVKMPMFETHFKMFSSCFLHIQYVVTGNKFTSFRPWLFLRSKNIYVQIYYDQWFFLLWTKIIIILLYYSWFMFSLLSLRVFYFLNMLKHP